MNFAPGQPLFVVGRDALSQAIEAAPGPTLPDGTRPSHVAYVSDGLVYEMTFPEFCATPLADWLDDRFHEGSTVWTAPLLTPLTIDQQATLAEWSGARVGMWYDVPELCVLGGVALWQRILIALGLMSPITRKTVNGVCSVNFVLACAAVGLYSPPPAATSFTPAMCLGLSFLGEPVKVEL